MRSCILRATWLGLGRTAVPPRWPGRGCGRRARAAGFFSRPYESGEAEVDAACRALGLAAADRRDMKLVKRRFREKAKELHPDVAGAQSGSPSKSKEELTRDFQRLLRSFQVLQQAAEERERGGGGGAAADGPAPARERAGGGAEGGPVFYRDFDGGGGTSWDEDVSRHDTAALELLPAELFALGVERDFHAAMEHAYKGPALDIQSCFTWPLAFEAEIRDPESDHPHLIQLTSGRTLIGHLSVVGGDHAQGGAGAGAGATRSWESSVGAAPSDAVELELSFAGETVARALRTRTQWPRDELAAAVGAAAASELTAANGGSETFDTINILSARTPPVLEGAGGAAHAMLGGGAAPAPAPAAARGAEEEEEEEEGEGEDIGWLPPGTQRRAREKRRRLRRRAEAPPEASAPREEGFDDAAELLRKSFWMQTYGRKVDWGRGSWAASPPEGSAIATLLGLREACGGAGSSSAAPAAQRGGRFGRRYEALARWQGAAEHHCRVAFTPGVEHHYWFDAAGRTAARVTRAALPDSGLWYFAPRSEHHTFASYYIERDPGLERRGWDALHPAICVFAVAFRALDRIEAAQARRRAGATPPRQRDGEVEAEAEAAQGQAQGQEAVAAWMEAAQGQAQGQEADAAGQGAPGAQHQRQVATVGEEATLLSNVGERLSSLSATVSSRLGDVMPTFDADAARERKRELHQQILEKLERKRDRNLKSIDDAK